MYIHSSVQKSKIKNPCTQVVSTDNLLSQTMQLLTTLITQIITLTIVCLIIIVYGFTYDLPIWHKSYTFKIPMPLFFMFIIICLMGSILYTYFEFAAPSEDDHYAAMTHQYQPRIVGIHKPDSNIDHLTLKGMINIGSVHTATSTIQKLLCRINDITCAEENEFSYFPDNTKHLYNSLFRQNPSEELLASDMITLSNWTMDINEILVIYPYKDWLSHWDIQYMIRRKSIRKYVKKINTNTAAEHDFSKDILYGKLTSHYLHPPTAIVFAHMAHEKGYKFFLHIREPIQRIWSVQQHWHNYKGDGKQVIAAAVKDLWAKYESLPLLQDLVNGLKDMTKSNDYIIGLYYKLYFTTLRRFDDVRNKVERRQMINGYTFEMTGSLYCVHIMFWLKQFERLFHSKDVTQYFRILQYEFIVDDLQRTKTLIYCWYKENVNNIRDCSVSISDNEAKRYFDNRVKAATGHYWSFEMSWHQRQKFMDIYSPCNQRLQMIIKQRPNLKLGEWINYNDLYEKEKQQNHTDDDIVDHPDRNTKAKSGDLPFKYQRLHRKIEAARYNNARATTS